MAELERQAGETVDCLHLALYNVASVTKTKEICDCAKRGF